MQMIDLFSITSTGTKIIWICHATMGRQKNNSKPKTSKVVSRQLQTNQPDLSERCKTYFSPEMMWRKTGKQMDNMQYRFNKGNNARQI